jgi:hypothetical protein
MATSVTASMSRPTRGTTWVPEPVGEGVVPNGALSRTGRLFQVTVVGSKGPTL